jgi:hypothetical protein
VAVCAEAATEAQSCATQIQEATVVEEATEAHSCAKELDEATEEHIEEAAGAAQIDEATEEHIEEEDEGEAVQGNPCALRMYSVRRNDQTDPIQDDCRTPCPRSRASSGGGNTFNLSLLTIDHLSMELTVATTVMHRSSEQSSIVLLQANSVLHRSSEQSKALTQVIKPRQSFAGRSRLVGSFAARRWEVSPTAIDASLLFLAQVIFDVFMFKLWLHTGDSHARSGRCLARLAEQLCFFLGPMLQPTLDAWRQFRWRRFNFLVVRIGFCCIAGQSFN